MSFLTPEFSGKLTLDPLPPDYFERLENRINEGFLARGSRFRAKYSVRRRYDDSLEFGADTFGTAMSLGLNEVNVRRVDARTIAYEVSFWRWVMWAILLSGGAGILILSSTYWMPDMAKDIDQQPFGRVYFFAMLTFWCVFWPWVLAAIHKPIARRILERVLREEAGESPIAMAMGAYRPGFRYKSDKHIMGLPLVSIAIGPEPKTGSFRGHAFGIVAIGDTARGVFALGGAACGLVSIGGASVGLFGLGGLSIGALAIGGVALGAVAIGGLAVGIVAIGGAAVGIYALGGGAVTFHELIQFFAENK